MKVEKYFDKAQKCWAVKLGNFVEYFNHETPEHDKKNADACFGLLQKQIKEGKCL